MLNLTDVLKPVIDGLYDRTLPKEDFVVEVHQRVLMFFLIFVTYNFFGSFLMSNSHNDYINEITNGVFSICAPHRDLFQVKDCE